MCGIIAIFGGKNLSQKMLSSLEKLEYRGYDSVGMAVKSNNRIIVKKDIGTVKEANEKLNFSTLKGTIGIAHCRWSTHGGVTQINAHPHLSQNKKIAVVHNGIIENYQEIRDELKKKGYNFISQTDTEVVPHLIQENMKQGLKFQEAFRKAILRLEGRYALVAMHSDEEVLLAARRGSPLVLGIGKDEMFISSDIPAFLNHTNNVILLDDNELAIVSKDVKVLDILTNKVKSKKITKIEWTVEQSDKNGFDHFMLKEILEQRNTLSSAIQPNIKDIEEVASMIKKARGTFFVGCGTAGKVCLTGTYLFSRIAGMHVNFSIGSEFPEYHHFVKPETLLIAVSQSGETADTLEAIEAAKSKKAKVVSIVNAVGSTMTRVSDKHILVNAGPEKCVASTKVTTSQIAILTQLAYSVAGKSKQGQDLLRKTSDEVSSMLSPDFLKKVKEVASKIKNHESIYIIGRGLNYPIALEAAIKLQEVPYIHAEGFAGGELKHGPLALISQGVPVIVIVANDETKKDILSNAMEVKARGGLIIGIAHQNDEVFDMHIKVPDVGNASPIANIIPIQLLAYYTAIAKGQNPDYLRNLAKSVTVK